jgi:HEAT repeat protein
MYNSQSFFGPDNKIHSITLKSAADIIQQIQASLEKIKAAEKISLPAIKMDTDIELKKIILDLRELLKENSLYPLTESQDILTLISCLHDLTDYQLRHTPPTDPDNPLLIAPAPALAQLYFAFLQQPLLNRLTLNEQVKFYLKAGKLFFNYHYYQETAWYWGEAYRLAPNIDIEQKLTQLEAQVYKQCSQTLFKNNKLTKDIQNALLELHDLALAKEDVTDIIIKLLDRCQQDLVKLQKEGRTKQTIDWCIALNQCIDLLIEKRQGLMVELRHFKQYFMDLIHQDHQIVAANHWKSYWEKFNTAKTEILSELDKPTFSNAASAAYSQATIGLLETIIQDGIAVLGSPPGQQLAIIAMGSLGRGDFSFKSDVDIAILIGDNLEPFDPYYRNIIHWLMFNLKLVGQPWQIYNDGRTIGRVVQGIQIDSGILSTATELINLPDKLAEHVFKQNFHGFYRPALIYETPDSNLFTAYQTALTNHFSKKSYHSIALANMEYNIKEWQKVIKNWSGLTSFQLKKHLLEPLTNWLLDVALYWQITDSNGVLLREIPAILQALAKYIAPEILHLLQEVWEELRTLKLRLQDPRHINSTLNLEQYEKLINIHTWLIKPLWQSIQHLPASSEQTLWHPIITNFEKALEQYKIAVSQIGNNDNAAISFDIAAMETLIRCLLQTHAPAINFVELYRQLPDGNRVNFIKHLEQLTQPETILIYKCIKLEENYSDNLLSQLNNISNQDGWRPLSAKKQQTWDNNIFQQLAAKATVANQNHNSIFLTWLSGQSVIKCQLDPAIAAQLFLNNGKINEANRVKVNGIPLGRRIVIPCYSPEKKLLTFAKFYPEFSGTQYFVNDITERLEGTYSFHITLAHAQHPQVKKAYPVLFSQPIAITLFDELKTKGTLKHLEEDLDPYFYTLTFFKEIALLLEDNKEDNIGIVNEINYRGQLVKRLISFDSDNALVEPLAERKSWQGIEEKVQAKSIVFCFKKLMLAELNSQAVEDFLNLHMHALLKRTAQVLQQRDSYYTETEECQKEPVFPNSADYLDESKPDEFCCIPTAFERGSISKMYQRLLRMQSALQTMLDTGKPLTHLEFFKLIETGLAAHYEIAINLHDTPEAIFHALPTDYIKKPITNSKLVLKQSVNNSRLRLVNSLTKVDELKRKNLSELIKEKKYLTPWHMEAELDFIDHCYEVEHVQRVNDTLYQNFGKGLQLFIDLGNYAYHIKEQVIAKLEWHRIEPAGQALLLQAMQGTRFNNLNLANCVALTDKLFQTLVTHNKYLQKLDISGCTELTELELLTYCPQLKVLIADRLVKLTQIGSLLSYPTFPKLIYLSLRDCALQTLKIQAPLLQELDISNNVDVSTVKLQAPELLHLRASQCKNLVIISTASIHLETADFTNCYQLPESQLTSLTLQANLLHTLKLTGCELIKHQSFREKYSFLLTLNFNEESNYFIQELTQVLEAIEKDYQIRLSQVLHNRLINTFQAWRVLQNQIPQQKIVTSLLKRIVKNPNELFSAIYFYVSESPSFKEAAAKRVGAIYVRVPESDKFQEATKFISHFMFLLNKQQQQELISTLLKIMRDVRSFYDDNAASILVQSWPVLIEQQRQHVTEELLEILQVQDKGWRLSSEDKKELALQTLSQLGPVFTEQQRQQVIDVLLKVLQIQFKGWLLNERKKAAVHTMCQQMNSEPIIIEQQWQVSTAEMLNSVHNTSLNVRRKIIKVLGQSVPFLVVQQRQKVIEILLENIEELLIDKESYDCKDIVVDLKQFVPFLTEQQQQIFSEAILNNLQNKNSNVRSKILNDARQLIPLLNKQYQQKVIDLLLGDINELPKDRIGYIDEEFITKLGLLAPLLTEQQRQKVTDLLLKHIEQSLEDKYPTIGRKLMEVLGQLVPLLVEQQQQAVIEALLKVLQDKRLSYVESANALGQLGSRLSEQQWQQLIEALVILIKKPKNFPKERGEFILVLGHIMLMVAKQDQQENIKVLLKILHDKSTFRVNWAHTESGAQLIIDLILAELKQKEAFKVLLEALPDKNLNLEEVLKILEQLAPLFVKQQPQEFIEALLDTLQDVQWIEIRKVFIQILGKLGSVFTDQQLQKTIEALLMDLQDKSSIVINISAVQSLRLLGPVISVQQLEGIIEALLKILPNELSSSLGKETAATLGRLGSRLTGQQQQIIIETFLNTLQTKRLKTDSYDVYCAIVESLGQLGSTLIEQQQQIIIETLLNILQKELPVTAAEALSLPGFVITEQQRQIIIKVILDNSQNNRLHVSAIRTLSQPGFALTELQRQKIMEVILKDLKYLDRFDWKTEIYEATEILRLGPISAEQQQNAFEVLLKVLQENWNSLSHSHYQIGNEMKLIEELCALTSFETLQKWLYSDLASTTINYRSLQQNSTANRLQNNDIHPIKLSDKPQGFLYHAQPQSDLSASKNPYQTNGTTHIKQFGYK